MAFVSRQQQSSRRFVLDAGAAPTLGAASSIFIVSADKMSCG
jgi:hypothetical protein